MLLFNCLVLFLIVPDDFYDVLGKMTQHGYRVLALGYRKLRMPWHHAEKLERYGLVNSYRTSKDSAPPIFGTLSLKITAY